MKRKRGDIADQEAEDGGPGPLQGSTAFTGDDVEDGAVAEFGFEEEAAALGGRQKKMLREKRKRAKPGTFGVARYPLFILPEIFRDVCFYGSLSSWTLRVVASVFMASLLEERGKLWRS